MTAASEVTNDRAQREKDAHNQGLKRGTYNSVFAHTRVMYDRKRLQLIQDLFRSREGGSFLEIGSASWISWIANNGVHPKALTCINISEVELAKGVNYAEQTEVKPEFKIMDANALAYDDGTFDVVYGGGILHHLDFEKAVDEVHRVLKPGGHDGVPGASRSQSRRLDRALGDAGGQDRGRTSPSDGGVELSARQV